MQISKTKMGLLIGGPVLVILIAVVGYFLYTSLTAQHAENVEKVEGFGELVMPASDAIDLNDPASAKLAPSIGRKNLTPTQRVIFTLKEERVHLLEEAIMMRQEIMDLKAQVAELESYKRTNERYAPHTFNEEVSTVHTRSKQLLATLEESKRFTRRQLTGMAAASAKEYRRFLTMHKLVLEPEQIDVIVNDHLPPYAYCIGDGIDVAANNRSEEALLVEYFKTDKTDLMSNRLKSDLKAIVPPCQELFAKRMTYLTR